MINDIFLKFLGVFIFMDGSKIIEKTKQKKQIMKSVNVES